MILINILMNGSNLKKFSYRWINNKTLAQPAKGWPGPSDDDDGTEEGHVTIVTDGGERRNPLDRSKVSYGST